MIKTGAYYKFNSKEDYIDFLETAEKEGFEWFCGQKPTDKMCISYYDKSCYFYINVDINHYLLYGIDELKYYTATLWTRKILTMKIIINEPAVVLIKNGKKYVSKAHNEEFDAEKGLLMCLAKANGVTHLDLKRMLKKATYQSKKLEDKV